jgi:Fe-S oxidoreductase
MNVVHNYQGDNMTDPVKERIIPVKPTYTSLFRRGRVLGDLLVRPGFSWITEPVLAAKNADWMIHQSCNAAFTPFIADVAQQAMALVGKTVPVIGGSESCCGELHFHFGDEDLGEIAARKAQQAFGIARAQTVVSICPDCDAIFEEKPISQRRYASANISSLIVAMLPLLTPLMGPVNKRVVVHAHHSSELTSRDASNLALILNAIPGLEVMRAEHADGPGRHCQVLKPMPEPLQTMMFDEARELGADGVVVAYHSCYRQHLKMQLTHGVETFHYLGLLGEALGLQVHEEVKRLRLMDDVEAVTSLLLQNPSAHGLRREDLREIVMRSIFC